jgi:hypothetical protein
MPALPLERRGVPSDLHHGLLALGPTVNDAVAAGSTYSNGNRKSCAF